MRREASAQRRRAHGLALPPLALALLLAAGTDAAAQTGVSSHERVGVERSKAFDMAFDVGLDLRPFEAGGMEIAATAGLEAACSDALGVSLELPLGLCLDSRREGAKVGPLRVGEPSLSVSLSRRLGAWRLSGGLEGSGSAGWAAERLPGGQAGLFAGAVRLLDPVALGLSLKLETELRWGRDHRLWRPLSACIGLSLIEAVNRSLAISLSAAHSIVGPCLAGRAWESRRWTYDILASIAVVLECGRRTSLRFGITDFARPSYKMGISNVFVLTE